MAAFPWHWSPPDVTEVRNLALHRSDEQLVEAVLVGDELATGALYDRLQPSVDKALRRVLQSRFNEFDGLAQRVFERILKRLAHRGWDGKCNLRTLATGIAGQTAMEALRKHLHRERTVRLNQRTERTVHSTVWRTTDRLEENRSDIALLHRVLVRMKPSVAASLVLGDVLGLPLADIAYVTGVSPGTALSRVKRARRELLGRVARAGNRTAS